MSKDPAFLFYPNDWSGGTMTFSRTMKGAYLDLLVAQFNQGGLSLSDIKQVLGSDFWMWDTKLVSKFQKENDLYFSPRLQKEMTKRRVFSQSRRDNLKSVTHMETHMENENEDRIPPNIDDVVKYFAERKNGVDPQKWFDFYTSKGWKIGKEKMVDWKAAVRTWEQKKEDVKVWPKHPKSCPDCFGNGYETAQGSGQRVSCRRKYGPQSEK